MTDNSDANDQKEARLVVIGLLVLVTLLIIASIFLLPMISEFYQTSMAPGVGLKDAAIISFFITVSVMVIFAIAAGDGFIGEIQFMLAAFFSFFIIIWLMVAWIF